MTRAELIALIENKSLIDFEWYRSMFSIPLESTRYLTLKDNVVTIGTESIKLTDNRPTPLLLSDEVQLVKGDLNVKEDGIYLLGDIILNYLMVIYPLGNVIPFTPKLSPSKVEDYISYELGKSISITEYEMFVEASDLIQQLADFFVTSSTDKSISPPPGIEEFKKKLYKEAREKYGDRLDTDIKLVVDIEKQLVEYDREYMKDDPTYNVVVNEKVISNARKNLYATIGTEIGMDGKVAPIVENSLLEGYPEDNKQIAALYNSSRKGSIMRGHMTQYTGADANTTSRSLNAVTVELGDCNTPNADDVLITKDNYDEYINYYIMVNNKPLMLTPSNINDYIGKTVKMRSYLYCKMGNNKYCSTCSGRQGEDNKKIAIVLSTENNAIFTNGSMKAMHDKTLKLVEYSLSTAIS